MKRIILNKKGFTLIELMIATVVFSVILLSTTTILLQLGRLYYKGVITNRTQETTRQIADEISQQIQFGGDKISKSGPVQYGVDGTLTVSSFCIGNQRYSYATNAKVDNTVAAGQYDPNDGHRVRHALWRDTNTSGDCTPLDLTQENPSDGVTGSEEGRELLSENMRLTKNFNLDDNCTTTGLICNITVSVLYGDDDLLIPAGDPIGCGNVVGSQWCAASTIDAQVSKRLRQAGS